MTSISIGSAVRYAWTTVRGNLGFFAGLLLIVVVVNVAPTVIERATRESSPLLSLLASLASALIQMLTTMGLIRISLKVYDGRAPAVADLFSLTSFWRYLLGTTVYGLIVLGGMILLIVPGIVWGLKYQFAPYLIVDKDLRPVAALERSGHLTRGVKWTLLLLVLVVIGINILGLLALGVGLLVTIPMTFMVEAYVYRRLLAGSETAQGSRP